ncbi:MAG: MaoC/PaaZ C-terminal domain-containing protein [Candidatus Entotheonellia bacterium]
MERLYFEDCRVGDRAAAPARTITETDIVQFAALTGDWHPLHTNVEYAKGTMFGERIAHGMLVLAIGTGLLFRSADNIALPRFSIVAAGLDKVRFVAPTKIGDTVSLESEVTQLQEMGVDRGLIIVRHRMMNQRREVVLTFTTKTLAKRRPRPEGTADG